MGKNARGSLSSPDGGKTIRGAVWYDRRAESLSGRPRGRTGGRLPARSGGYGNGHGHRQICGYRKCGSGSGNRAYRLRRFLRLKRAELHQRGRKPAVLIRAEVRRTRDVACSALRPDGVPAPAGGAGQLFGGLCDAIPSPGIFAAAILSMLEVWLGVCAVVGGLCRTAQSFGGAGGSPARSARGSGFSISIPISDRRRSCFRRCFCWKRARRIGPIVGAAARA